LCGGVKCGKHILWSITWYESHGRLGHPYITQKVRRNPPERRGQEGPVPTILGAPTMPAWTWQVATKELQVNVTPGSSPGSACIWVRETFELSQLKSTPSQLLPVFPGFHRLQTCCRSFGPANILYFFPSAGLFLLHCNDNWPRNWALISKLVFQCSKIMKMQ
jgi:hypothetical protein